MHRKTLSLLFGSLLSGALLVQAQNSTDDLPPCAALCAATAAAASGCLLTDAACLCSHPLFRNATLNCASTACRLEDISSTNAILSNMCANCTLFFLDFVYSLVLNYFLFVVPSTSASTLPSTTQPTSSGAASSQSSAPSSASASSSSTSSSASSTSSPSSPITSSTDSTINTPSIAVTSSAIIPPPFPTSFSASSTVVVVQTVTVDPQASDTAGAGSGNSLGSGAGKLHSGMAMSVVPAALVGGLMFGAGLL
ncbi:hypothetical protein CPC08DRAFT_166577 [Agrocybe pediades]|nr:hypothetical protein CPC08DRAFT_166577 [Agrocybe pediades]